MGLKRISVSLVFQQVIQIQYHQVLFIQFNIQATSCHRFSTFHLFILVFKEERHAVPQTLRTPLPCQPSPPHAMASSALTPRLLPVWPAPPLHPFLGCFRHLLQQHQGVPVPAQSSSRHLQRAIIGLYQAPRLISMLADLTSWKQHSWQ